MSDEGAVDVPWYVDADGDSFGDSAQPSVLSCMSVAGHSTRGGDCDDMAANVHPGAAELCDRVDNDCSSGGGTDVNEDFDDDGHSPTTAACAGRDFPKDDCDDDAAGVHGGAAELCDGMDNDCSTGGGLDASEDMDGDFHAPVDATCDGGYARDDCDDSDALAYPGAAEVCDRVDRDCSSGGGVATDEDMDDDGHAAAGAMCSGGFPRNDCDDAAMSINPQASDLCNGSNDDWDSLSDEGCASDIIDGGSSTNFDENWDIPFDLSGSSSCGLDGSVGLSKRFDASGRLRSVRVVCREPSVVPVQPPPFSYELAWSTSSAIPDNLSVAMGGGNVYVTTRCPDDMAMVGVFNGGSRIECARIEIMGSQGDYELSYGTITVEGIGGSGGTALRCPDGHVLTRLSVISAPSKRVRIHCQEMAITVVE